MLRMMMASAAALLLAFAVPAASADDAGKIVSLEGTVEIGHAGAFTGAGVGSAVQSGDTIRTGNPGRARVLFADDSVLNLADGSTLLVDETVYDASKGAASTLLHLLGGKVRAVVSDYYSGGQGSYRIETTTAVSGVRGTEFIVAFEAKSEKTEILGLGGLVEVHSTKDRKNHGVLIHANEITDVLKGKYPTPPRIISTDDERYRQMMAGTDLPGSGLPETLLLEDPAFHGGDVVPPGEGTGETTSGGTNSGVPGGGGLNFAPGGEAGGGGTGETNSGGGLPGGLLPPKPLPDAPPIVDFPGSNPGHSGGDLIEQPPEVLDGPTDIDVNF